MGGGGTILAAIREITCIEGIKTYNFRIKSAMCKRYITNKHIVLNMDEIFGDDL
jgi:hypothetical protein